MSDNKKYYYLKLKDNFFDQDHIKYIEAHEGGYIFSNILMKLYLRALKHEGCLKITELIPYDPQNIVPLSKVIGHDPSHVGNAINLAINLGVMTIKDGKEMWFTDIQNYIGESSTEADRIRLHRKKIKNIALPDNSNREPETLKNKGVQMYDKRTPELELELELELKKEIELDKDKTLFDFPLLKANVKFVSKWKYWLSYRADIKKKVTPKTAAAQLKKLDKMGVEDAMKSIDASIEHGWQGLFEPKGGKSGNPNINAKTGSEFSDGG